MVIELKNLSKKFRNKLAVDGVPFTVPEGRVTGFIGSNGAGKTTAMRCMLGLNLPTSGEVLIDGVHHQELKNAPLKVGAIIDSKAFHKTRSARSHLVMMAVTNNISAKRVDEVLELTGLTDVANRAVGKFSLGMTQHVGIAAAPLGDPKFVILDEPVNGLDPEGVVWVCNLYRRLAKENKGGGSCSSHLMSARSSTQLTML
ncbi:MAG: ATP-binding cassette domain-containing protein [Candidatus Ancillula trichonymphae]|nr:ATP-binding cassette domain-containing protein [Candidatus Ancillula trichonymphae]